MTFTCQGGPGTTSYFFSYRTSRDAALQQFGGTAQTSTVLPVDASTLNYLHVQCTACVGDRCAPAEQVNTACNYEFTKPQPTPTPPPPAVCGQTCNDQIACSGTNIACVNGTCRSTLCAPEEQTNECACRPPQGPMCVNIYASKTAPRLNDQVVFTCAQVPNAVRYEFRTAYLDTRTGTDGALITSLAPASATSNVSQPFTINRVGRYIAQCRPCAANDLCLDWEPLTSQIGGPELAPADAANSANQNTTGNPDRDNVVTPPVEASPATQSSTIQQDTIPTQTTTGTTADPNREQQAQDNQAGGNIGATTDATGSADTEGGNIGASTP